MKILFRSLSLLPIALLCASVGLKAQIINAYAGTHVSGYSGDGGSALAAQCYAPAGMITDAAGNLYFCDLGNSVVRKISTSGIITTIAGTGVQGFSGNGGPATAAKLSQPTSVAIDDTGNVLFTDDGNNMIRKVSPSGIITTIAGTGTAGYIDNLPAEFGELNGPSGIAVDHRGNIFIADVYNHAVRKIDTSGKITTISGGSGPGYTGNGSSANIAKLNFPKGIALDTAGNIYIVDQGNSVIRRINQSNVISAYAGNGSFGYSGDGGYGYAAKLNSPTEVTVDRSGNLYIADFNNHVVRRVRATGFISTMVGNGSNGYSGDGASATAAQMAGPYGVAVDNNGKLYISDEINNVIRVVDMTTGITENIALDNKGLKLYPNPSGGDVTVEIPMLNDAAELTVIDVTGRTVQTQTVAAGNTTNKINLSGIPTGTYLIKVTAGTTTLREKIVVW